MSRTIHADGRTVTVPDDATAEEINQIFGPSPAQPSPMPLSGPVGAGRLPVDAVPAALQRVSPVIAPAGPPQNWRDRLTARIDNSSMAPDAGARGQVQQFGQGAAQGMTAPVLHPVRTALSGALNVLAGGASGSAMGVPSMASTGNPAIDAQNEEAKSAARADAAEQGQQMVANPANAAGNLAGGLAVSHVLPAITESMRALPAAAETSAAGIWNRAIGARGMKGSGDFARKANPGRGAVSSGIGPSGSMDSIAGKAADARDSVGQQIGDAYARETQKGTLIPADDVRNAVHPILDQAKADASAPLVEADPAVYERLKSSLEPALQAADAKGGFTPSELWNIRDKLNKSLNWKDTTKASLTQTQQQISGALGGVLEDNVPGIEGLNENYKDLVKLADRSAERAATGSGTIHGAITKGVASGIGGMVGHATGLGVAGGLAGAAVGAGLDSIPIKTTLAAGLGSAGKALRPVGEALRPVAPIAQGAALPAALTGVSGNNAPESPRDTQNQQGSQPAAESPEENIQASPPAQSIAPEHTPDTHTFSSSEWIKSNPDGDPDEAKQAAETLGYTVTD